MPNWCVGTLKIRGKQKDVKRFVLEGLKPVNYFGVEENPLKIDEYNCVKSDSDCYIKDSYRSFIEDLDVWFYGENDDDITTYCLEMKAAWDIKAKPLAELSKEYNIDMKIYAYERGMEFNRDIEIKAGNIIKNNEIKFNDYLWDCDCPTLGG